MGKSVHVRVGHFDRIESEDARLETLRQALAAFPDPLSYPASLAIAAAVDARPVRLRGGHHRLYLRGIWRALMILAPRRFLCEPKQIGAGNVVTILDPAVPHPANKSLGGVRVRLRYIAKTVGFYMVDPMKREAGR